MSNSGEMLLLATCENNGASYDTHWVPASGQWASAFGMTAELAEATNAKYVAQGYKRISNYVCGTRSVAVWHK